MLRNSFNVSKESEMSNFFSKYIKKNEPKINSSIENNVLFDGDDYLFKSLTSNVKTYFEYGCGKSTEYMYNNSNLVDEMELSARHTNRIMFCGYICIFFYIYICITVPVHNMHGA